MNRRHFLQGSGALAGASAFGLAGCKTSIAPAAPAAPPLPLYDQYTPLVPIRAHADRIFRITVCLRPFRAAGPRMDIEKVGDKTIVHNYGHGGSGWSLSWGSASIATESAMKAAEGNNDIAVLGAGAIGLTSATLLQRAGAKVTIYAKERAPFTRSSRATGSWTPDSRIALTSAVDANFPALWEKMARTSFSYYQSFYGAPGSPIEWTDRWSLSDTPRGGPRGAATFAGGNADATRTLRTPRAAPAHDFIRVSDRIEDLTPKPIVMPPGSTPFPTPYVTRSSSMTFNVAVYSRQLLSDFLIAGGKIETREFHSPQELTELPQKVIVNCPGFGGKALWNDDSITPVRGQIAWLIPQEDAIYGLSYKGLSVLSRRDGIVLQGGERGLAPATPGAGGGGEDAGWNEDTEVPDRTAAENAVSILAELYSRMQSSQTGKKTKA